MSSWIEDVVVVLSQGPNGRGELPPTRKALHSYDTLLSIGANARKTIPASSGWFFPFEVMASHLQFEFAYAPGSKASTDGNFLVLQYPLDTLVGFFQAIHEVGHGLCTRAGLPSEDGDADIIGMELVYPNQWLPRSDKADLIVCAEQMLHALQFLPVRAVVAWGLCWTQPELFLRLLPPEIKRMPEVCRLIRKNTEVGLLKAPVPDESSQLVEHKHGWKLSW